MKGLIFNSFYKTIDGAKILLSLFCFVGIIIILFLEQQFIVYGYIIGVILTLSVYSLSSVRKDMETKWNRYEATLPIRRKDIIKSKYLFALLYLLFALIITIIFTTAIIYMKKYEYFDFGMKDIVTLYFVSTSLVFQIISYFYIFIYLFNFEYIDISIIISTIIAIIVSLLVVKLLNWRNVSIEEGRVIMLGIATFILYISYRTTIKLYCRI